MKEWVDAIPVILIAVSPFVAQKIQIFTCAKGADNLGIEVWSCPAIDFRVNINDMTILRSASEGSKWQGQEGRKDELHVGGSNVRANAICDERSQRR
jgi:hypothetical protein